MNVCVAAQAVPARAGSCEVLTMIDKAESHSEPLKLSWARQEGLPGHHGDQSVVCVSEFRQTEGCDHTGTKATAVPACHPGQRPRECSVDVCRVSERDQKSVCVFVCWSPDDA